MSNLFENQNTMKIRNFGTGLISFSLILLFTFMSGETSGKAYTPVGTWEYMASGVPAEYQYGKILITQEGKEYGVTIAFSEYYKVEGQNVVYDKKSIKFSIYVEGEEVKLAGTFDGDSFTGTATLSGGVYELSAKRVNDP